MCEQELARKYERATSSTTILESSLHLNLAEHINSEIGLGTIYDVPSAREWMQRSFLSRRIRQNPARYITNDDGGWEEGVDAMLTTSVDELKKAELVKDGEQTGELVSTEYGDIMSKVSSALQVDRTLLTLLIVLHPSVDGMLHIRSQFQYAETSFRWRRC